MSFRKLLWHQKFICHANKVQSSLFLFFNQFIFLAIELELFKLIDSQFEHLLTVFQQFMNFIQHLHDHFLVTILLQIIDLSFMTLTEGLKQVKCWNWQLELLQKLLQKYKEERFSFMLIFRGYCQIIYHDWIDLNEFKDC